MYENRDHIAEALGNRDDYFVHQQDENIILVRNHKDLVGPMDQSIDWTVILIEGGIWQYNFTNKSVSENSKYVPVQDAIKKILTDANLN